MEQLKITSIEDLKKYSEGQVVQLPDFAEGQPFVAKLKRPSMLVLVSTNQIPNALLQSANSLFIKGTLDPKNPDAMGDVYSIIETMCNACFVEPTYKQIKDAGITLTDDQMMFVFSYSQQGVKALDSFRKKSENPESVGSGTTVQCETV